MNTDQESIKIWPKAHKQLKIFCAENSLKMKDLASWLILEGLRATEKDSLKDICNQEESQRPWI